MPSVSNWFLVELWRKKSMWNVFPKYSGIILPNEYKSKLLYVGKDSTTIMTRKLLFLPLATAISPGSRISLVKLLSNRTESPANVHFTMPYWLTKITFIWQMHSYQRTAMTTKPLASVIRLQRTDELHMPHTIYNCHTDTSQLWFCSQDTREKANRDSVHQTSFID